MGDRWTVGSINGEKNGQEGEWKSLDQIQGMQTSLKDNLFGIRFRIIPKGFKKFSDVDPRNRGFYQENEFEKSLDNIRYRISEIQYDISNPYYQMLRDSGVDMKRVLDIIKQKLTEEDWSWQAVQGLMPVGVVDGIYTKLNVEDNHNNTNRADDFKRDRDIDLMRHIENEEWQLSQCFHTPKEIISEIEEFYSDPLEDYRALILKKYKKIVEREEKKKDSGAKSILEFMQRNGLTTQDLSLALAMAQATKTGIREAEGHIIDERTSQIIPNREEPTELE